MTDAPLRLTASAAELADDFAGVRRDLAVPASFSADVTAEAEAAARQPGPASAPRVDARDLDLLTIDPEGSRDLDQAFHAAPTADGFVVHYAIADVAAFVAPGGALDREAFRRGVTLYLPDGRAPLYPPSLGEGAASLLPDVDRPALLWTFDLDAAANPRSTRCERATVRSRRAWSYVDAQRALDDGHAPPSIECLRAIGGQLLERERERGGVSIPAPAQEIVKDAAGGYALELEAPLPLEAWNAQISLLTGREAARLMAEAGVGIVRTLPPPDPGVLARLRRTAAALGIPWSASASYADVVRGMVPSTRARATFLLQALHALRGAGYALVRPGEPVPQHSAVGAPYAHVTAPLRRLADRYANEIVLAACAGATPPGAVLDALPVLVTSMPAADRHAAAVNRACVDAVETAILSGHVGQSFGATIVDRHRRGVVVMLTEVPIVVTVPGSGELGADVAVRLEGVDRAARTSQFVLSPR